MRARRPAQDLRFAIDCLPRRVRKAMLEGIERSTIIVGAYTDRGGGVCPMLAAHRHGGRTDLASFARAWDRYTRAGGRSRRASARELRTLHAMLEVSLACDDRPRGELAEAVAEHRAAKTSRAVERAAREIADPRGTVAPRKARSAPRADTGERDRSPELRRRTGWAWLRVFRRYDEYEAALERIERAEDERDAGERGAKMRERRPA
jgi:hypothetical protein